MNLGELRQRVLDNLGDDGQAWAPPGEAAPYARIDRLINDTIDELSVLIERVDPTFLRKSASLTLSIPGGVDTGIGNTGSAALPADFRRVLSLWEHDLGVEPHQVQIIDPERVPFYYGSTQTIAWVGTAEPAADQATVEAPLAYIYVQQIRGGGGVRHTLWYTARTAVLVNQADVPSIPIEFHHVIALGASVRALKQEDSPALKGFQKDYADGKAEMIAALPARDGSTMVPT